MKRCRIVCGILVEICLLFSTCSACSLLKEQLGIDVASGQISETAVPLKTEESVSIRPRSIEILKNESYSDTIDPGFDVAGLKESGYHYLTINIEFQGKMEDWIRLNTARLAVVPKGSGSVAAQKDLGKFELDWETREVSFKLMLSDFEDSGQFDLVWSCDGKGSKWDQFFLGLVNVDVKAEID